MHHANAPVRYEREPTSFGQTSNRFPHFSRPRFVPAHCLGGFSLQHLNCIDESHWRHPRPPNYEPRGKVTGESRTKDSQIRICEEQACRYKDITEESKLY